MIKETKKITKQVEKADTEAATKKRKHSIFKTLQLNKLKNELPVISRSGEYYKTTHGDCLEILKINGTSGVRRFTSDSYMTLIKDYTEGVRTLTHPFNFIILDFLVDHQKQIDFYNYKISQLDLSNEIDQVKQYWLLQEVQKLEYRQLHATEEQYFLLLFSETEAELETKISVALEIPYLNIEKLSPKHKDAFIYKMNNLNSSPYNMLRGDSNV